MPSNGGDPRRASATGVSQTAGFTACVTLRDLLAHAMIRELSKVWRCVGATQVKRETSFPTFSIRTAATLPVPTTRRLRYH